MPQPSFDGQNQNIALKKPLSEVSCWVTRHFNNPGHHKNCPLSQKLRESGANVLQEALIDITYTNNQHSFNELNQFDWLFFTSHHGILSTLAGLNTSQIQELTPKIAVLGENTAKTIRESGLNIHFTATGSGGIALAKEFTQNHTHETFNIGWPCGNLANQEMKQLLENAGHEVKPFTVYKTRLKSTEELSEQCLNTAFDMVIFTSPSAVLAYKNLSLNNKSQSLYACIGQSTGKTTQKELGNADLIGNSPSLSGLAQEIIDYYQNIKH